VASKGKKDKFSLAQVPCFDISTYPVG